MADRLEAALQRLWLMVLMVVPLGDDDDDDGDHGCDNVGVD